MSAQHDPHDRTLEELQAEFDALYEQAEDTRMKLAEIVEKLREQAAYLEELNHRINSPPPPPWFNQEDQKSP